MLTLVFASPKEPSLSLTLTDLQRAVSDYAGFGYGVPTDATELGRVNDAIGDGLRMFYYPEPDDSGKTHEWSFMRPVKTLVTVSGTSSYELPNDFGGIEGPITYAEGEFTTAVKLRSESFIRELQQSDAGSGYPTYAALRPKAHTGLTGQRWNIILWPTPNAAYNLTYRYNVDPQALTASYFYPLGGQSHAQTIKQACRAAAEQLIHDQTGGAEYQLFRQRLRASIAMDRAMTPAESLGLMTDRSDDRELVRRHTDDVLPSFTFNTTVIQ